MSRHRTMIYAEALSVAQRRVSLIPESATADVAGSSRPNKRDRISSSPQLWWLCRLAPLPCLAMADSQLDIYLCLPRRFVTCGFASNRCCPVAGTIGRENQGLKRSERRVSVEEIIDPRQRLTRSPASFTNRAISMDGCPSLCHQ